jgi:hypothetical protein
MSDHTIKNKMGETALDSAKAAQEAYDKSTFNFPKFSTSVSTEEDLATSRHGIDKYWALLPVEKQYTLLCILVDLVKKVQ